MAKASEAQLFKIQSSSEASIHLPLRLAIYEKAHLNFTKNNGPGTLQLYSKANTIFFNSFDDDEVALSKNWYETNFGMHEGDQYPVPQNQSNLFGTKKIEKTLLN